MRFWSADQFFHTEVEKSFFFILFTCCKGSVYIFCTRLFCCVCTELSAAAQQEAGGRAAERTMQRHEAGRSDSAHTPRGRVLQTQLSGGHAAPYAPDGGGAVVLPGQLINHRGPPCCRGQPSSTGQAAEPRALCQ